MVWTVCPCLLPANRAPQRLRLTGQKVQHEELFNLCLSLQNMTKSHA